MRPKNINFVKKMQEDFSKLKKKKIFTADDEEALVQDLTGLLGIYAVEFDAGLKNLIEEMISFGEAQGWAMQGSRIEFDRINAQHKSKCILAD